MPSTSAASEYLLKREFGPEQYDVVEAIARRLDVLTTDIGTYYEAADFFLDPQAYGRGIRTAWEGSTQCRSCRPTGTSKPMKTAASGPCSSGRCSGS